MSQGKYSPCLPTVDHEMAYFRFNCFGEEPTPYDHKTDVYDQKLHFGDYDPEGFDKYGYSAFSRDGVFVGHGSGIDRLGNTEMEYLCMSPEDFEGYGWDQTTTRYPRNRE